MNPIQVQPKKYTLTLTDKETDLVYAALNELPAKHVFELLMKVRMQIAVQNQPPAIPDTEIEQQENIEKKDEIQ
jgi:hypothetical protein